MDFDIPTDLEPSQVRDILLKFQGEIAKRLTLNETIRAFAKVEAPNQSLYVDLYAVDGILRGLTRSVTSKLDEAMERNHQLDTQVERLFSKVNSLIKLVRDQSKKTALTSAKALKSVRNSCLKQLQARKTLQCFKEWRNHIAKIQKFKQFLRKTVKNTETVPLKYYMHLWHKNINDTDSSSLKNNCNRLNSKMKQVEDTLQNVTNSLESLEQGKASQKDFEELKTVASKTDVRVLFQDIKNIVFNYTSNIKNKYDTQIGEIRDFLGSIRNDLCNKADNKDLKEATEKLNHMKNELIDFNKHSQIVTDQLMRVDNSSVISENEFKINLLDRKIQAIENRFAQMHEDKSLDNSYSRVIRNVYTLTTKHSPLRSNRPMSIVDELLPDPEVGRPPKTAPNKIKTVFTRRKRRQSDFT